MSANEKESKEELLKKFRIDREPMATARPASNRGNGRLLMTGLLMVAFVAGGWFGSQWFGSRSLPATAVVPPSVQPTAARSADDAQSNEQGRSQANAPRALVASGFITARRAATVSATTIGLIEEVLVTEGLEVEEGQVLARLDSSLAAIDLELLRAQAAQLELNAKSLEIELGEAKRRVERQAGLANREFANAADLLSAQAGVETLEVRIQSVRVDQRIALIRVRRQQRLLNDFTIRAPFAGIVTTRNAQAGEIISPSSAGGGYTRTGICTIVDMASLEIVVDVNETLIGRVYPGQQVKAELYAYDDWEFAATVENVIPSADKAKATFRVRISIDEADARILPDMAVKVRFIETEKR